MIPPPDDLMPAEQQNRAREAPFEGSRKKRNVTAPAPQIKTVDGSIDLPHLAQKTAEFQELVHDLVEQFMVLDERRMAWQLVRDTEEYMPDPLPKTWSLLLDFPDSFDQWPTTLRWDALRQAIHRKYEELLEETETALGIEWTGGERGTHTLLGEMRTQPMPS